MENKLEIFNFNSNEIRVIEKDGEPWFVGKDVAEVLGYSNTSKAISDHCKRSITFRYSQNNTNILIIPESDLYRLVIKSKLPAAEQFEKWVMEEVLPQIRKTGSYSVLSPLQMLQQTINQMVEMEQKMNKQIEFISLRNDLLEERLDNIESAHDHFTIIGYFSLLGQSVNLRNAQHMGKRATNYCKKHNIEMGDIPDPRFGRVHTYPKYVLDLLFPEYE